MHNDQSDRKLATLKLREHPRLMWPTVWVHAFSDPTQRSSSDIGTLIEVVRTDQSPRMLFLVTDFEGTRYMGALLCKDLASMNAVERFLNNHLGTPIREIGDLEVTLSL
jgi:hypothetical protein